MRRHLLLGLTLLTLLAGVPASAANADWLNARGGMAGDRAVLSDLRSAEFVLLGEVHDNPEHHRIQADLLAALIASGRRPALVWEMLEIDDQASVEAARGRQEISGDPAATALAIADAVGWSDSGWPDFALYAPIMEQALKADLPILAGGIGRSEAVAILDVGGEAYARLRGWSWRPPDTAVKALQLDALYDGHCALVPRTALAPMLDVQLVRDVALAETMLDGAALPDSDGAVLVAGHGHARRDVGVPWHLARLAPDRRVASIGLLEADGTPASGDDRFDWRRVTPAVDRPDPCEALRRRFGRTGQ